MTDSLLQRAKAVRETVLLAELGAWLHDLGKLSRGFVESKTDLAYGEEDEEPRSQSTAAEGKPDPRLVQREACSESPEVKWVHGCVLKYDHDVDGRPLSDWLNDWLALPHTTPLGDLVLSFLVSNHHSREKSPPHIIALLRQADRNDSGEDEYNAAGLPQSPPVQRATVFGREDGLDLEPLDDLRQALYARLGPLVKALSNNRDKIWELLGNAMNHGLGKTQRAANDIRLDQHVWGVASRFKAFVMRDLLEPPPVDTEGKPVVRNTFRLLTVQWNSWEAITPFARLSDVVGRMAMITQVRHALRQAIETEHAIGNRIYEDDDGIHFLVADVEWGTELETLVRNIVNDASGGELLPVVTLSGPTERVTDLARQMAEARKTLPIVGSPVWLEGWQREGATELCPVCHRRPSPGDGALCSWCKEQRDEGFRQRHAQSGIPQDKRRADASSAEAQSESTQPAGTLQTGELADERGKTALIVARFDLEDWLKGDLLHTLFITSPQDMVNLYPDMIMVADWQHMQAGADELLGLDASDSLKSVKKYRSDIRNLTQECLRLQQNPRVTRETLSQKTQALELVKREFWAALIARVGEKHQGEIRGRVDFVRGELKSIYPEISEDSAYFLLALARKNPSAGRLLRVWQTTEEFLQGQADALAGAVGPQRQRAVLTLYGTTPPEGYSTAELPGLGAVDVWVRTDDKVCKVQTATYLKAKQIERLKAAAATGAPLRWLSGEGATRTGEATITHVDVESYAPYQVITRSPNLLLAMVPADRALEIAQQIQSAYAAEFSKVQGRLPFHVGLAFMDAHYPMFAALDTARRLAETFDTLGNRWMEAQIRKVEETTGAGDGKDYTLELESARFGSWKWTISARLGNGAPDWYHPYVLVKAGADLEQRGMSLQGPQGRWVHVSQVEVGDAIEFLPNLYDFISLDTVSRRLEAGLLPDATRRAHPLLGSRHSPRPYLLERVNELQAVWDAICNVSGMSESRLQAATTLLARKWEEWQLSQRDTHRAEYAWLVQHTVARDFGGDPVIEQAILDGLYFDVIDLYRHILKQSLEKSKMQTTEETAS